MFSGSDYSVHTGRVVTGWPVLTMRRGEIVYRDGEIRGTAGSGQLVPRSRWQDPGILTGPVRLVGGRRPSTVNQPAGQTPG